MIREPLTDQSPMPFGKYKDEPMEKVPARYLHWLWENGMAQKSQGSDRVGDYIRDNMTALQKEHQDGIWSDPA